MTVSQKTENDPPFLSILLLFRDVPVASLCSSTEGFSLEMKGFVTWYRFPKSSWFPLIIISLISVAPSQRIRFHMLASVWSHKGTPVNASLKDLLMALTGVLRHLLPAFMWMYGERPNFGFTVNVTSSVWHWHDNGKYILVGSHIYLSHNFDT